MFKTILATTFALALALPAASAFATPSKDCLLSQVAYVQPQSAQVQQGKVVRPRLVGAVRSDNLDNAKEILRPAQVTLK